MPRKRSKHVRVHDRHYADLEMIARYRKQTVQTVVDDAFAEYIAANMLTARQLQEVFNRVTTYNKKESPSNV